MKKSIAFGDSILKGVILDDRRGGNDRVRYTLLDEDFTRICEKEMGFPIDNYGRFGSTITTGEKILQRHSEDICDSRYTLLEFGGNDSDFNWNEISANPEGRHFPKTDLRSFSLTYKAIIDRVRHLGSHPVMLSLTPLDADMYFRHITSGMDDIGRSNVLMWLGGTTSPISSWHEMYNIQIFKLAIAMNVPVVDITSAFLYRKDFRDYLCEDGIHPNKKGHKLIADAVCDHFRIKR